MESALKPSNQAGDRARVAWTAEKTSDFWRAESARGAARRQSTSVKPLAGGEAPGHKCRQSSRDTGFPLHQVPQLGQVTLQLGDPLGESAGGRTKLAQPSSTSIGAGQEEAALLTSSIISRQESERESR